MIYVPEKESYQCYVVQNENVIRAYKKVPQYNTTISYRDYYIMSLKTFLSVYSFFSEMKPSTEIIELFLRKNFYLWYHDNLL